MNSGIAEGIYDEQEKFYSGISAYYSRLFPFNPAQLSFVEKNIGGLEGKRILDLGCGTGELALRLAEKNAIVDAIDLNEDFISIAGTKNAHPGINYREMDMLETGNVFPPKCFDAVICFGNTLVHLPNTENINGLFRSVYSVLKSGGSFLIQILNYDYITVEKIKGLPVIENEEAKFIRQYYYPENSMHIRFHTELIIKENGETIMNETSLLPLKSRELTGILKLNGFGEINYFSDFQMNLFGGKHLPMVVSCLKK